MKKVFLVALHVKNTGQARDEASKILSPKGAHGVILVNNFPITNENTFMALFDIASQIARDFPGYNIGINPLDCKIRRAIVETSRPRGINILWKDESGIIETKDEAKLSDDIVEPLSKFKGRYFGSIDLKYQPPAVNLERVIKVASQEFDVVVTSGPGTGMAASVEKIELMRSLMPVDAQLALASGVTRENIELFALYVDIFIVGTSLLLEKNNQYIYDENKIEQFREELEKY